MLQCLADTINRPRAPLGAATKSCSFIRQPDIRGSLSQQHTQMATVARRTKARTSTPRPNECLNRVPLQRRSRQDRCIQDSCRLAATRKSAAPGQEETSAPVIDSAAQCRLISENHYVTSLPLSYDRLRTGDRWHAQRLGSSAYRYCDIG